MDKIYSIRRLKKEEKLKKIRKKSGIFSKLKFKLLNSSLFSFLYDNSKNDIIINKKDIILDKIPKNFIDLKILFVSDLHLDVEPNNLEKLKNLNIPSADILILGGDLFDKPNITKEKIEKLKFFLSFFRAKKIISVLGNHDSINLLNENLDINFLVNETLTLAIDNSKINIFGIDDYTLYESEDMHNLLKNANKKEFNILISHNPDVLLDLNLVEGFDLQLSGHTHGGQIILPFKYILHPHTRYKKCVKGIWKEKELTGFTSSGFGCSSLPLRNISPEICFITFKK